MSPSKPRLWPDVAVAAALLLLTGLSTATIVLQDSLPKLPGWEFDLVNPFSGTTLGSGSIGLAVAAVGMPLAAVWRASRPVASALAVYVLALAHFILLPTALPVDVIIFLSLYSVTVHGPRWAERLALAGALFGALLVVITSWGTDLSATGAITLIMGFAFGACLVALAWGAGLLRRSRATQRESLRDKASRLERERDQQAALATAAERTRIAREMHDIVAHSLSVVIAQADGGRYAVATDSAAAERALETIAETGRAALTDMRRILGVLRSEVDDAADPSANNGSLAPLPSTDDLDALFAHVRASGVAISHVDIGTPVGLPPGTSTALYRITQESLTNVLKHGGPGVRATVLTEWRPGEVRLTITDDGRGAASISEDSGHGLVGMRERAVMLGGTLQAGPAPGGGYRVEARIPVGTTPDTTTVEP